WGQGVRVRSGVVAAAASGPVILVVAAVLGVGQVGGVLSGALRLWSGSPAPSFAYQWLRCDGSGLSCVVVVGATGSSYTLVAGDVGSTLVLQVMGSNSAGSAQAGREEHTSVVVSGWARVCRVVLEEFGWVEELQVLVGTV